MRAEGEAVVVRATAAVSIDGYGVYAAAGAADGVDEEEEGEEDEAGRHDGNERLGDIGVGVGGECFEGFEGGGEEGDGEKDPSHASAMLRAEHHE